MTQQINLFNPIFLKQEKYFSALAMAQAMGLVLLACLALAGYTAYRAMNESRQATTLGAQLKIEQAQLDKLVKESVAPQKNKALEEDIRSAEEDVRAMRQVSDVLGRGDVGNTLGFSEYFRALSRQTTAGVWLTGLTIQSGGNDITLVGRALRPELVPGYVARLRNESVMKGKSFAALEIRLPEATRTASAGKTPVPDSNFIEFSLQSSSQTSPERPR